MVSFSKGRGRETRGGKAKTIRPPKYSGGHGAGRCLDSHDTSYDLVTVHGANSATFYAPIRTTLHPY